LSTVEVFVSSNFAKLAQARDGAAVDTREGSVHVQESREASPESCGAQKTVRSAGKGHAGPVAADGIVVLFEIQGGVTDG
jgi:hypothetical protein